MPSSKRGGKSAKSDKSSKKHQEDAPVIEDKKEEILEQQDQQDAEENPSAEIGQVENVNPEHDNFSNEPSLTELIIEKFEGGRDQGHFEGFGIAYFTNQNYYEGNFVKGMMHGKGKYMWTEEGILYEGDFYLNQISGTGTYTWPDGSSYEGNVLNGIRHGSGTYRHPDGLSYMGQWDMGRRHGEGRLEYDSEGNSFYDGQWHYNIPHGYGYRQYKSGNSYEGTWYYGQRHGRGIMRWVDRDEMYSGQWEDGVQHGMGQHIWYVRRVKGSQYPLRNLYDGEFVHGKREGYGVFYYPNGARYEGYWKTNLKSGQGKFIMKNGRVYEGVFENDCIKEFPEFSMSGRNTPDISGIRTRSPAPMDNISVHSHGSSNTISPSFQLYIDHLLQRLPDTCDGDHETQHVKNVLLRYYGALRRVYNFYSSLGNDESQDNVFIMYQMQFWRFMKDCKLHHYEDVSLTEIDRYLAEANNLTAPNDFHNPTKRILFLEFINLLVTIAYHLYHKHCAERNPLLSSCLIELITRNIMPHSCMVKGFVFADSRKFTHAMTHIEKAYNIYQRLCQPRERHPFEPVFKMRQFIYMLKDFNMISKDLTPTSIVNILAADDPQVADDSYINMEREMTFLEFFEALVGCASLYVTEDMVKKSINPEVESQPEKTIQSIIGESAVDDTQLPNNESPVSQPPDGKRSESPPKEEVKVERTSSRKGQKKSGGKTSDKHHPPPKEVPPEIPAPVTPEPSPIKETPEEQPNLTDESRITETAVEEDIDPETKAFNLWTDQLHIFFIQNLFTCAENFFVIEDRLELREQEMYKEREEGTSGEDKDQDTRATHLTKSNFNSTHDSSTTPKEFELNLASTSAY